MAQISAFVLAVLLVGCSSELDRRIKIVLPDDFRGDFTIVKDREGTAFARVPEYYVFTIPLSGELRTSDISPFFKLHQLRIEYADGRVLIDYAKDIHSHDRVTVKSLGTTIGQRQTGPSSWDGSTDYDGTTMRWKVVDTAKAP